MKPSTLRLALILSLLVNLGVLGAVGYRALGARSDPPALARYLALNDDQRLRWREAESAFLARLAADGKEIRQRLDRLIREIFADAPDATRIEAERAAIARRQDEQQRLVIEQLLRERGILDVRQRERLARLLLDQQVGASSFEQLHRD